MYLGHRIILGFFFYFVARFEPFLALILLLRKRASAPTPETGDRSTPLAPSNTPGGDDRGEKDCPGMSSAGQAVSTVGESILPLPPPPRGLCPKNFGGAAFGDFCPASGPPPAEFAPSTSLESSEETREAVEECEEEAPDEVGRAPGERGRAGPPDVAPPDAAG